MPEEKPIEKVEAYRCKVCTHVITGTEEEALEHAQQPADTSVPEGFVYKIIGGEVDKLKGTIWANLDTSIDSYHKVTHTFYMCDSALQGEFMQHVRHAKEWHPKQVKDFLTGGIFGLLTEQEFTRFAAEPCVQCFVGAEPKPYVQLVRTTPELEALVSEGKLAREIMYKAGLCNREEDKLAREIMEEAGLKERTLHERHEDWKRQVEYFEEHKEEIRKQYGEAYVAICDGQIIASDPDEWKLVERLGKKDDGVTLIASVKDSGTVIEFPSPEIWEGKNE